MSAQLLTFLAPVERSSAATIERQRGLLSADAVIEALLDSFPEPAAILNADRQIVRANEKMAELTGRPELALVGLRTGEALGCQYGYAEPGGCGTTPGCTMCGAAKALGHTQAGGGTAVEDCRITLTAELGHQSLDLRIRTRPFPYKGEEFAVFAVRDTSDEQRRRVLERMFFHDVLNAAGGLRDVLRLWPQLDREEAADLGARLAPLAAQVVEEIESQRDLAAAERGELATSREAFGVEELLEQLVMLYRHHTAADRKTLDLGPCTGPASLRTDPVLLRRVLGNLVKNALEASVAGQRVTIGYDRGAGPRFSVHNQGVMPDAVRLQIFQRSFSTKGGKGRGIGTYSARLLTERYLGGHLVFASTASAGTTFVLELPPTAG